MAKSKFQRAVEDTPEISSGYRQGLRALKKNERGKVVSLNNSLNNGSLDIDLSVKSMYPNDNRWDYAFGYSGKVCYVEVHPAYTSEVSKVEAKLKWLKRWLRDKAPLLNAIPKASPAYIWVQTQGAYILPGSSEARKLSTLGITLTSVHKLK